MLRSRLNIGLGVHIRGCFQGHLVRAMAMVVAMAQHGELDKEVGSNTEGFHHRYAGTRALLYN